MPGTFPAALLTPGDTALIRLPFPPASARALLDVPVARRDGGALVLRNVPVRHGTGGDPQTLAVQGAGAGFLRVQIVDAAGRGSVTAWILVRAAHPARCRGWLARWRVAPERTPRRTALARLLRDRCADPHVLPLR